MFYMKSFQEKLAEQLHKSGNKPFVTAFSALRMIVTVGWVYIH